MSLDAPAWAVPAARDNYRTGAITTDLQSIIPARPGLVSDFFASAHLVWALLAKLSAILDLFSVDINRLLARRSAVNVNCYLLQR